MSKAPDAKYVGCHAEGLPTPAQAAAQFHIPEYLLRRACSEGRLEHLRVVNALWLIDRRPIPRARRDRTSPVAEQSRR